MDINPLTATSPQVAPQSGSAFSQLTDNFDTFLTLLTTQLQNQDPLDPLNTEQFTQQLVQFSGVEQSIQTNANLETLIGLQAASQREQSLDLVERVVTIDGASTQITEGQSPSAQWQYALPASAQTLNIRVLNSTGDEIARLDGPQSAGTHTLVWNGRTESGRTAPPGRYTLEVSASDATGNPITPALHTRDRITSVQFTEGTPQILVAGQFVDPALITRIDTEF